MAMTDPIADMLTRIRNASRANREEVDMPSSKLKADIARILKEEGFIKEYRVLVAGSKKEMLEGNASGKYKILRIFLRYGSHGEKMIRGIQRVSKPGCRVYISSSEIKRDHRMPILSTSYGIMSGFECRKKGVGGELLCRVW
jgi:small subunit ribosomal protein S8